MPYPTLKAVQGTGNLRMPFTGLKAKIAQKIQDVRDKRASKAPQAWYTPPVRDIDLPRMAAITQYTTRVLDQEIDTVVVIPAHPEFVVVGTYNLKKIEKSDDDEEQNFPALRCGSLQILPFEVESNTSSPNELTELDRKDFLCAIVDVRFHPKYENLLGAATSMGEMRFFNIMREYSADRTCSSFRIIELGVLSIWNQNITIPPLITQFVWLPWIQNKISNNEHAEYQITLAACDSLGVSQIVELNTLNDIRSLDDPRVHELVPSGPPSITIDGQNLFFPIHKQNHDLEAWCISSFQFQQDPILNDLTGIILSGGDDCTLLVSQCQPVRKGWSEPTGVLSDKRSHKAGIVSILPLSADPAHSKDLTIIPVLTGSYDEHIRLFLFDTKTMKMQLKSEFQIIAGGVWKIALLDTYIVGKRLHYVLLISAMHAGARIVRLSVSTKPKEEDWKWGVEAVFEAEHESMVYACAAKERNGKWSVMSTSFYDKKVCGWEWVDGVKEKL